MAVVVRPLRGDDAWIALDIHARSVHGLAAAHYPPDVVAAWAVPPTDANIRTFLDNVDGETRVLAELDGRPVGLGALVVARSELRACYVVPEAAGKGVGTALVTEIERLAREIGLERLELLASVNAEPFYASLGYETHGHTQHVLRTGHAMAAVRMAKRLR